MMATAKMYIITTAAAAIPPLVVYYNSGIVRNGLKTALPFLFPTSSENNEEYAASTESLHEKVFSPKTVSENCSLMHFLPLMLVGGIALAGICVSCCYRRKIQYQQLSGLCPEPRQRA